MMWTRLMRAVIVESTYGVNRHEERVTREQRLVSTVRGIVSRGGRVLMPVVALGRAQVRQPKPNLVFVAAGVGVCLPNIFLGHF